MIREIKKADHAACLEIYNKHILEDIATLEIEALSLEAFTERLDRICERFPFLVLEEDGEILGYAYLDYFNTRAGYRYVCDLSIYLSEKSTGKGHGSALLKAIEDEARKCGFRTIISIITSENLRSIAFHEKHGFVLAGYLNDIAVKFGRTMGAKYYMKRL